MPQEIERKFLVRGDFKAYAYQSFRIVQGYLSSVPERTVRIRVKGEQGYLTVKGKSDVHGVTRYEWEKEIAREDAEELLKLCEHGVSVGDLKEKDRARFRNQKIGIVMQDYALIDEYTIEENVQIPLIFGKVKGNDVRREKIMTALENVGLAELAKKPVRQLSGGQKQRVAIARALVNNPAFLLADEPTGALDSKTSGEIMDVFEKLNQGGKTVIIVTHDMEVAARCGRVIEISDGEIE